MPRAFGWMLALCLCLCTAVHADLAPHLDIINMDLVWADPTLAALTGAGQAIAVLDTGVDTEHVSFGSRVPTGSNWAADDPPLLPDYRDGMWHGTFVASVAAGARLGLVAPVNGVDEIGGVAPGADIISVRVLDNTGSGTFQNILDGLEWVEQNAAALGIAVVNMSLGTTATFVDPQELLDNSQLAQDFSDQVDTLRAMGITVVAASGNSGSHTGQSFPAILANVIGVGSTDIDPPGDVSSFTNLNSLLDMLAPGGVDAGGDPGVWGAIGGINFGDPHNLAGTGSGTSFSAPQVAAAVLLIRQRHFDLFGTYPDPDQILQYLQDGGVAITVGEETFYRLDVYGALLEVPEPCSLTLIVLGTALCAVIRRRRKQP